MSFASPVQIISDLRLPENAIVADFGCGTGGLALPLAEHLSGGTVYAVDVQKELLDRLTKDAQTKGLTNLKFIWGDIEERGGSKIGDSACDMVILSNVLFQSSAKYSIFLEAKRILKTGGKLAVVEWLDSFGGLGPQASDVVSPDAVRDIATQAGLSELGYSTIGDHHYVIIFINR